MTISTTVADDATPRAVPKAKSRNLSLDRARTFLTLVVILHHAVIPYTYYGHTDPKEFFGFDMIVLATDSFFMAMFFFLSGLFVWSGIARKGAANYLADRLLRLGLRGPHDQRLVVRAGGHAGIHQRRQRGCRQQQEPADHRHQAAVVEQGAELFVAVDVVAHRGVPFF